jgi:DNA segregation ATPase FtsK/SpoIIIE, S-DNA-T family
MSITRMITKTPIQNESCNIYETTIDENLIQSILTNRFIGEGVFCLEQLSLPDYSEQYLISPSFSKFDFKPIDKQWQFDNELVAYELELTKPYFLPLDIKQHTNLFKFISELNCPLFTQLLLTKRVDKWRESTCDMYEDFLNGNDYPLDNKLIRTVQSKVINVLSKVTNYNARREPIEEIEQKILSQCYRFECRIVLLEPKLQQKFEETVRKLLEKLNLFNELYLKRVKNPKNVLNLIKNRSFQHELLGNMLSEKEIVSLLCDKELSITTHVSITQPVRKKGIVAKLEASQMLQRALKLLPYEEKKDLTVDKTIITQMQQAFSRVKISKEPLKVTNVERGSRIQKIEIKIPSDINYLNIKKNIENIRAALGKDALSIEIADKPETVNLYVPCDETELIYLTQILESPEFHEFAKNKALPFVIGEDVIGKPLFACLNELRHLLIAGESGSGKSVYLNCLLICLILYVNPNELILYLVDPKMVELKPYEGFHQVKDVIVEMNKASELLNKLTVEMDKRYEMLSKEGYRDIMGYNKSHDIKIPYIVTVIEEYADLVATNPEVEEYIARLGAKARAAGIHLIIVTQRPSADILDGAIKTNLPARISFKLEATSDYVTVFGKGIPFEPLGRGDGCARIETLPKHYQRFQSPIITLDDDIWRKVIIDLKETFHEVSTQDIELMEIEPEEEPINKLKRIIVNSGELRVSELQKLMNIKMNRVSELMKELVEEEWLGRDGRSYVIVAEEDELNKWKD